MTPSPALTFTVFTPTYNRAHTLHRAYQSLQTQTCRDFEWLIVDDGSEDGTEALVKQWQREALVPVRYIRQPHAGAHHAHQTCLAEARGELIIKLDSDDGCTPRALERLKHHWLAIPSAARAAYSGVTALCQNERGHLVGDSFPESPLDCSAAELEYCHHVHGEKWGCVRADVLRQFPFPTDVPGNFIPESYIWVQVSRHFKTRHVNEILRIYWTDAPSLVHGVPDPKRNAAGHRLMFQMVLQHETRWFRHAPRRLLRAAAQFTRFASHSGLSLRQQWRALTPPAARLLWLATLPLAATLLLRDRLRRPNAAPAAAASLRPAAAHS
jgi:glycosyltransferase involved in cell wall biosynthesis